MGSPSPSPSAGFAPWAREAVAEPEDRCDISDHRDCAENRLAADIDEPTDSTETKEPMLPMDANDPMLPTDSIEPLEATDRNE